MRVAFMAAKEGDRAVKSASIVEALRRVTVEVVARLAVQLTCAKEASRHRDYGVQRLATPRHML